jgi:hyperosmotically inducible protein
MKTHCLMTLCAALAVGAALVATPATAVDLSKEKALVNDSWLTAKTRIALAADARVKGRQVNVETKKGLVILRGKVDTAEAKTAAGEIALGIEGVTRVRNELQVVAATKRKVVQENDDAITKQVKRHLEQDTRLKNADIDVKTHAGVVSLTGEVTSLDTSANASMIAWRVPGVRSVKNDITIKMGRG